MNNDKLKPEFNKLLIVASAIPFIMCFILDCVVINLICKGFNINYTIATALIISLTVPSLGVFGYTVSAWYKFKNNDHTLNSRLFYIKELAKFQDEKPQYKIFDITEVKAEIKQTNMMLDNEADKEFKDSLDDKPTSNLTTIVQ